MNGLSFEIVHQAMSYWQGALSAPVLMINCEEAALAVTGGAIVWDVRSSDEFRQAHAERAVSLGGVDWLLADDGGGNLIPADVIAEALAGTGIQPGREVVIYAEQRAVDAFVALRALRSIGVTNARVCLGDPGHATALQSCSNSTHAGQPGRVTAHRQDDRSLAC